MQHEGKPVRKFLTTQWTLVAAAGDAEDPRFREALSELCELYWYPVYAYVRRWGASADDAQDLTQGFFSHLLEKRTLRAADRERGRFRSFLLAALKFYLADERDRAHAQKRGGGSPDLGLDLETAESRYRMEADPGERPDTVFARRWALELLDHTYGRLQDELSASAHPERARRLATVLRGDEGVRYKELGAELEMSEAAVKVAIHRLRRRFGALLREEVARTVADPAEVDGELRSLLSVIR